MSFWNRAIALIDRLNAPQAAHAHCDVPCGIYDPRPAQIAAETVMTMVQKMQALDWPGDGSPNKEAQLTYANTLSRMIVVKEQHAEIVKHEIQVLWSDYFKPPHLQQFPDLHDHVWNTLKQASFCKQHVDLDATVKLQEMVDVVADWFYESKGIQNPYKRVEEGHPLTDPKSGPPGTR